MSIFFQLIKSDVLKEAFPMKQENHIYIAIDLKSFYASVECIERNLDPMTTNLVVADASRTEKTICLAVSPSLKSMVFQGEQDSLKLSKSQRSKRRTSQKLLVAIYWQVL